MVVVIQFYHESGRGGEPLGPVYRVAPDPWSLRLRRSDVGLVYWFVDVIVIHESVVGVGRTFNTQNLLEVVNMLH